MHREASLTITVGADAATTPVGPRGALPPSSTPVVQLTYHYGCRPVRQAANGLRAIVLAAGEDGGASELRDPDDYPIVLE